MYFRQINVIECLLYKNEKEEIIKTKIDVTY